jgi:hypothetical protein
MRGNGAQQPGRQRVVAGLRAEKNKGGLQMGPESSAPQKDPDQEAVVSMVGRSLGPVLDDLAEAGKWIRKAQEFRTTAKSVGAHEAELMIARELRGLEVAARVNV